MLFKDECIRSSRHFLNVPLIQLADVARATRGWVHSYNTVRLHGPLASVPPDEFEKINYAKLDPSSNEATVRRRDKLSDPNMGSKGLFKVHGEIDSRMSVMPPSGRHWS
ncbi:hypothetical protein [Arthrobacter sp. NicSoilB8]|uniref:hypothetical protein n=1 Tax=Arthrobacter sp. NicSoilB8 TaxID=2830998 RepID=UPI001CC6E419|nr:hypothetical protein [Arthrobacter sp. NicSoilB8]BCW73489.1 hypothetical protein NicSoilB8_45330 [Arthrobacter sp. NicSoilB8]